VRVWRAGAETAMFGVPRGPVSAAPA
jgi:hypothetical protein